MPGQFESEHLAGLARALEAERRWQRAEYEANRRLPLGDRVAVGIAWAPVHAIDIDGDRWRTTVTLRSESVLHEGISSGDPVILAPAGSPDDGVRGLCLGAERRVAEVRFEGQLPLDVPLAVTLAFDDSTFRRYREALLRADAHPSPLRDVLLGMRNPGDAEGDVPDLPGLNPSQEAAARAALAAPEAAVVHGPPGTGKTHVIVAMLAAAVAAGDRPWALADSNAAVDHLALRAAAAGLKVVRLGHPARIGSAAWDLSLDRQIAAGPLGKVLHDLDREIVKLSGDGRFRERRQAMDERRALRAQGRRAVIDSAQVIAVTLGTLARVGPDLPRPRTAILDEATQALEPAAWVPVPWVDRLVLVGDPHQLGPVVVQPGNPLEQSMLGRLAATWPMPMLTVQHRMHREIQALVHRVYGATYTPHPSVAEHVLAELPGVSSGPATTRPVLWIDTAGAGLDEERDDVTRSLYNDGEARLVTQTVSELLAAGVRAEDIGVIAPYSAQVGRLGDALPEVEVATVNAFQGREKEAIVCSFVRSNPDGQLGFVADERRLTVAITRARRCWVGIGDSATLGSSTAFTSVFDRLAAVDAWATVWDLPDFA